MTIYPNCDLDRSAYRATVRYTGIEGWPTLHVPGAYENYSAAARHARRIRDALLAAGEQGIVAFVTYSGERPTDFPRNGVALKG